MEFLNYIQKWHNEANANNFKFMSNNTYQGFVVSLKTALQLSGFLINEAGYKYLMTHE